MMPRPEAVLAKLISRLDENGVLREDDAIGERFLARARENFCDDAFVPRAALVVIFPPPAASDLERLDALAQAHLGGPLPVDVRAFYAACGGIFATPLFEADRSDAATRRSQILEIGGESGVQSVARLVCELEFEAMTVTQPSGGKVSRHLTVLPVIDVPDQGWMALDPWRPGWPMIEYWFDEVDISAGALHGEDARTLVSVRCRERAPSLAQGLSAWIASGFDPFWPDREDGPFGESLDEQP